MNIKRKIIIGCFLLPPVVIALFLIERTFFPWSPVNCWSYEVDINSGQIRYTRYFCFMPVKSTVKESSLSRTVGTDHYRNKIPEWHRVTTFSPGVNYSPHYSYHSAMLQIELLEYSWQLGQFTPAARRSSALRVLTLWQAGKSDGSANAYMRALSELGMRKNDAGQSTDEKDLPETTGLRL